MTLKCSPYQRLILATGVLATCSLGIIVSYSPSPKQSILTPTTLTLPVIGLPTAEIEIVIFQDFRCKGCRKFHETMIPEIRSDYIESGRVRCRFVPLGFLEGSKPLANAALAVYGTSPDRFADYESALFERFEQEVVGEQVSALLLNLASEVGGIDIESLRTSIETNKYYEEIDRNLDWARSVMGKKFRLPAVYVNGAAGPTQDLKALKQLIEKNR